MSDLRWSDCDEQVVTNPIGALLCRTSKLNDHAHILDAKLERLERNINWYGVATTSLGLLGTGLTIFRSLHG